MKTGNILGWSPTLLEKYFAYMADADSIRDLMKSHTITFDVYDALLGKRLGGGYSRQVYECRLNTALVVKIERPGGMWQNIREHTTWEQISCVKEAKKWLAPVLYISDCGTLLIQKRCEPIRTKELPKKVPHFLTDFKKENFGLLDGRVVCFDYGCEVSSFSTRMKSVDWSHET